MNNIHEFIIEIQRSFGKYKSGMSDYITNSFAHKQIDLESIFRAIMSNWTKQNPPPYREIINIARNAGINMPDNSGYKIIPICEFCYWGIKYKTNAKGQRILQHPNDIKQPPKKIVELFEISNHVCPICFQRPGRGQCLKRYDTKTNERKLNARV